MSIIEAKKFLQEKGYCTFNLKEFNSEYFQTLKENFQCNENKNFKNGCKNLKATVNTRIKTLNLENNYDVTENKVHVDDVYQSFQDAEVKKNEIIDLIKNNKNYFCAQLWFHTALNDVLVNMDTNIDSKSKDYIAKIDYLSGFLEKSLGDITRYFFDISESQELSHLMEFTYYDKGCYLNNHSDGTGTGRICAILIYLNENYDANNGGILVLNNVDNVVPEIGNVAIIDLQSFDIPHMVTEVTDGIGRYAFLSFVKRKQDEFIHSHTDRKKTLI